MQQGGNCVLVDTVKCGFHCREGVESGMMVVYWDRIYFLMSSGDALDWIFNVS